MGIAIPMAQQYYLFRCSIWNPEIFRMVQIADDLPEGFIVIHSPNILIWWLLAVPAVKLAAEAGRISYDDAVLSVSSLYKNWLREYATDHQRVTFLYGQHMPVYLTRYMYGTHGPVRRFLRRFIRMLREHGLLSLTPPHGTNPIMLHDSPFPSLDLAGLDGLDDICTALCQAEHVAIAQGKLLPGRWRTLLWDSLLRISSGIVRVNCIHEIMWSLFGVTTTYIHPLQQAYARYMCGQWLLTSDTTVRNIQKLLKLLQQWRTRRECLQVICGARGSGKSHLLCHSVRVCTDNDLTDADVYKCEYLAVDNCESLSASALVDLLWQRVHHSKYTQIAGDQVRTSGTVWDILVDFATKLQTLHNLGPLAFLSPNAMQIRPEVMAFRHPREILKWASSLSTAYILYTDDRNVATDLNWGWDWESGRNDSILLRNGAIGTGQCVWDCLHDRIMYYDGIRYDNEKKVGIILSDTEEGKKVHMSFATARHKLIGLPVLVSRDIPPIATRTFHGYHMLALHTATEGGYMKRALQHAYSLGCTNVTLCKHAKSNSKAQIADNDSLFLVQPSTYNVILKSDLLQDV